MVRRKAMWAGVLGLVLSVAFVCVGTAQTDTPLETLSKLRKEHGVETVPAEDVAVNGFRMEPGAKIGGFVVVGVRYCSDLQGVEYRFAREVSDGNEGRAKNEPKAGMVAEVRVHRDRREAIDHILRNSLGYATRPRRGNNNDQNDIGDLSFCSQSGILWPSVGLERATISSGAW